MARTAGQRPPQLYLLYGNQEAKLNDARYELVCRVLEPEDRSGNLSELRPPGNQPFRLEKALNEITSELATISLLGGIPRVVVVYQLSDFFGASKGKPGAAKKTKAAPKTDPVESFGRFIREILPQTENIGIFVCEEDEDKNRTLSDDSPLVQLFHRHGEVRAFREKPIAWEFEGHLYGGDLSAAVTTLRRWHERAGSDSTARLKLYRSTASAIELLLQAKCVQLGRDRGVPPDVLQPPSLQPTLTRLPEFKRRQVHDRARTMTLASLRAATARLDQIQRLMYPTGTEAFIADWFALLEQTLLELGASAQSPAGAHR